MWSSSPSGQGSGPAHQTGPYLDFGEPDAGGGDPDQQLTGARLGDGHVVDAQRFEWSVVVEADSTHAYLASKGRQGGGRTRR